MQSKMPPKTNSASSVHQEKPSHYQYLKNFRISQCPMFADKGCNLHRPYTCFHWHFDNQRRRRPIKNKDGQFNYDPDDVCPDYDSSSGVCPNGDECPRAHTCVGDAERRYHPRYYKTAPCLHDTDDKGICTKNGIHCAYAHGTNDLREPVIAEKQTTPKLDITASDKNISNEDVTIWKDSNHIMKQYKVEPCKKRNCRQGFSCPGYHNLKDKRRCPLKFNYKGIPCAHVKRDDEWGDPRDCAHGDNCLYCHTRPEHQFHPEIYKSIRCYDCASKPCPRGIFCAFAHSDQELRNSKVIAKYIKDNENGVVEEIPPPPQFRLPLPTPPKKTPPTAVTNKMAYNKVVSMNCAASNINGKENNKPKTVNATNNQLEATVNTTQAKAISPTTVNNAQTQTLANNNNGATVNNNSSPDQVAPKNAVVTNSNHSSSNNNKNATNIAKNEMTIAKNATNIAKNVVAVQDATSKRNQDETVTNKRSQETQTNRVKNVTQSIVLDIAPAFQKTVPKNDKKISKKAAVNGEESSLPLISKAVGAPIGCRNSDKTNPIGNNNTNNCNDSDSEYFNVFDSSKPNNIHYTQFPIDYDLETGSGDSSKNNSTFSEMIDSVTPGVFGISPSAPVKIPNNNSSNSNHNRNSFSTQSSSLEFQHNLLQDFQCPITASHSLGTIGTTNGISVNKKVNTPTTTNHQSMPMRRASPPPIFDFSTIPSLPSPLGSPRLTNHFHVESGANSAQVSPTISSEILRLQSELTHAQSQLAILREQTTAAESLSDHFRNEASKNAQTILILEAQRDQALQQADLLKKDIEMMKGVGLRMLPNSTDLTKLSLKTLGQMRNTLTADLKQIDDILNSSMKCAICLDRFRQIMLGPCNHLYVCVECADKQTSCPYCQCDLIRRNSH